MSHAITPGQTLENPVTGPAVHAAATTDGELLAFDVALRPGAAVPTDTGTASRA